MEEQDLEKIIIAIVVVIVVGMFAVGPTFMVDFNLVNSVIVEGFNLIKNIQLSSLAVNNIKVVFITLISICFVGVLLYSLEHQRKFRHLAKFLSKHLNALEGKKIDGKKILQSGTNVAAAILEKDGMESYYWACSKINEDEQHINTDGNLCYSIDLVKKHLPAQRLNSNFEWEYYNRPGFAGKYLYCAERKIVAHILEQYNGDELKGCELAIYTQMEPCIYCYNVIDELKKKWNIKINLFFDEMILELKNNNEKIDSKYEDLFDIVTKNHKRIKDLNEELVS